MSDVARTGLALLAHGARDARWAEPFQRLRQLVAQGGATPVELAYLEMMQPDLATAVARLTDAACTRVVVVPVFLGQGGHVRRDLPELITRIAKAHPGLAIECVPAAGEDASVLAALASYCISAAGLP